MQIVKNILLVTTILFFFFVIGILFFFIFAGDDDLTKIYVILVWILAVIGYHYLSYAYYDDQIIKGLRKQLMIILGLVALGLNLYILYHTFVSLFDAFMNYSNLQLNANIVVYSAILIFGLLGVLEIVLLLSRIKSVTQKVLILEKNNDIEDSNFNS